MKTLLLKHKPADITDEKFKEMWENASYLLEPLLKVIKELAQAPRIKKEDFDSPAFTYRLVHDQARYDLAEQVLSVFPKKLLDK